MDILTALYVLIAIAIAVLSAGIWLSMKRRRIRRNLALAFVGEISALVREFEDHSVTEILESAIANKSEVSIDLSGFSLPKFVTYEANATRLNLLGDTLTRQMSYFYCRLAMLSEEFKSISISKASKNVEARRGRLGRVLSESRDEMILADEILRHLRNLIAGTRPPSISRA